jgi:15-cis-phytoene synthase
MKALFDNLSERVSKMTTNSYSTSFSLGIYFINQRLRKSIYGIYGFVRIADEIVDSFEGYDKENLLARFRKETYEAIENRISVNPILNSFQQAVHDYGIENELIDTFLDSMQMDLQKIDYTNDKFEKYILGSAEVVGLMCLRVFTEGNSTLYEELKPFAMKLGAGFQKVNFLRDMKDDYFILGRSYFPNVDFKKFDGNTKKLIEKEIDSDFKIALAGIRKLPSSSRAGVYLAFVYYRSLLSKIKKMPPHRILTERIRINNPQKLGLMVNSLFEYKMRMV